MTPLWMNLIHFGLTLLGQQDVPTQDQKYSGAQVSPVKSVEYYAYPSPAGMTWIPIMRQPTSPSSDQALVGELIKVLEETKSKETFSLTLEVLVLLKGDRKRAIPAVLRNAERLGISNDMTGRKSLTPDQMSLARCLRALIENQTIALPDQNPQPPARLVPTPAINEQRY